MPGPLRYVDDRINTGLERLKDELSPVWHIYSPPFRVRFGEMNQARDVAHQLATTPQGYLLVWADADIIAEPGVAWTDTLAFLRAGAPNANAIIVFYTLREDIRDA